MQDRATDAVVGPAESANDTPSGIPPDGAQTLLGSPAPPQGRRASRVPPRPWGRLGTFIRQERGLETVEYVIMTALIVVSLVVAIPLLGDEVASRLSDVAETIKDIAKGKGTCCD